MTDLFEAEDEVVEVDEAGGEWREPRSSMVGSYCGFDQRTRFSESESGSDFMDGERDRGGRCFL